MDRPEPLQRQRANDDENELDYILGAAAALTFALYRRQRMQVPRPLRNSVETCGAKVERLLNENHKTLFNKIRMSANSFLILSSLLQQRGLLRPSNNANVDEMLMISLEILGQGTTNREAQEHWNMSAEIISRWFGEVLNAICSIKDDFIKPPNYNRVQRFIQDNEAKYRPWFDDCVGALDGTHVHCVPPADIVERYRNRKGYLSQNVLAVCSFNMKFTYMLSGWEGSAHDARVLQDALSDPAKHFPRPPPGKFILVDSGYANNDCFLAPYRGQAYHLQEYRGRTRGIMSPRELFNYTHSSLRNCIERTFGVWKARFLILKRMNNYPLDKQVRIPIACVILHNFIHIVREQDILLEKFYHDAVSAEDIDPTNDAVDVAQDEDDTADVPDDIDEDDDADINVQYYPPIHNERNGRIHMGRVREHMTNQMWEAFGVRSWHR